MDPTMLAEVVKQVPALGVLVWVVVHFLKHLEGLAAREERNEAKRAASTEALRIILDTNTEALARNTYVLETAIRRFDGSSN